MEGVLGAILAGGRGRRIGGDKATVSIGGIALLRRVLDVVRAELPEVAVVAKRDTDLPELGRDAEVWLEPDLPRHPLCGIVQALRWAGGRDVLVVACDLALLDRGTVRLLAATDAGGAPAVIPRAGGRLHPLCARYRAAALATLAPAASSDARLTDVVAALAPQVLDFEDETPFFSVNAPEDVITADAALRARARARAAGP